MNILYITEIYPDPKRGLRLREVPVRCFYTEYSKARGTTIASGFKIFFGLINLRVSK